MGKPDDKWLTLVPDQPAAEAARYAVRVRSAGVFPHLKSIAEAAIDPKPVHQLRVSTRRAGAVLRLFADCFPGKRLARAKRHLRTLRRAAGGVRDWDVFLESIKVADLPTDARAALTGYAAAGRSAAARDLLRAAGKAPKAATALAALAVSARPADDPNRTAADLGRTGLPALLDEFTRDVAAGADTPEQLHRLRIAGKRLRYAIEVFAGCFAPALREAVYPAVADLQESLGRVNDAHTAVARLTAIRDDLQPYAPAVEPAVTEWIRTCEAEVAAGHDAFRGWADRWRQLLNEHPPGTLFAVRPLLRETLRWPTTPRRAGPPVR